MGNYKEATGREPNKRERAKQAKGRKQATQGGWDWTATDWLYLAALVQATSKEGGAVRVGLTRDKGAMALGMYHSDQYGTEYIKPGEDFAQAIIDIAEAWLDAGLPALELELQTFQKALKMA